MKNEMNIGKASGTTHLLSGKSMLIGIAGTLAAAALVSMARSRQYARRYGDRAQERRDPTHFFMAGRYPHRREIDRSGAHPLFERRQSVYDAY